MTDPTTYDENALSQVATLTLRRRPTLGSARLVAVDGPAGSGKTTFATHLHQHLTRQGRSAATLHMDDLYEDWTGLEPALETRIVDQVLGPLGRGDDARWQQYDWHAQRFDRWHDLVAPDVLILEGCGSGARAYAEWTTTLVWLEAARETRVARGVARDGADVLEYWLPWMRREEEYFAVNNTRSRADLVVTTD